jgi:enamine deaminase RidA (YjgF/YER057c/UK114 family)
MKERNVVPFDTWALKVDVKVSQMISVGGYSWSCGQCPLGANGEVLKEYDLVTQTEITCDYIEKMLARADLDWSCVNKLETYYVNSSLNDSLEMMKILEQRAAGKALLVPIVSLIFTMTA